MTTTTAPDRATTTAPDRATPPPLRAVLAEEATGTTVVRGRWPVAGIVAAATGYAATMLGPAFITDTAIYAGGPEAVFAQLDGAARLTQLGAAAGYLTAALLVPFGIGMVRTLLRRVPEQLALVVSFAVLLATAVATMTSGFIMKSVLASGLPGGMDADFYTQVDVAVVNTIAGQVQWAGFIPVVAAAGVLAVLALRHGAMQRWVGAFSAVLACAVAVVTIALNLPWSAGLVTPLWLVAVSIAVLRLRRTEA